MVREGLRPSPRLHQGPRQGAQYYPVASVLLACLLSALPIMSRTGWWPDFGLLMLIAWRMQRSDAFPSWWAAPLGLFNDLAAGHPIGQSVVIFSAAMLVADILDHRVRWRDYWTEWLAAALLVIIAETIEWLIARLDGAPLPYFNMLPSITISILIFPLYAVFVAALDRYRLRR